MDGWMGGLICGWTDGWMDECMGGWMDGRIDEWMDVPCYKLQHTHAQAATAQSAHAFLSRSCTTGTRGYTCNASPQHYTVAAFTEERVHVPQSPACNMTEVIRSQIGVTLAEVVVLNVE